MYVMLHIYRTSAGYLKTSNGGSNVSWMLSLMVLISTIFAFGHIVIIFPVSISTYVLLSPCHFAPACQIS